MNKVNDKLTEEFLENSQKDFDREMALLRLSKTMDEVAITAENAGLTPEILNELLADE